MDVLQFFTCVFAIRGPIPMGNVFNDAPDEEPCKGSSGKLVERPGEVVRKRELIGHRLAQHGGARGESDGACRRAAPSAR